MKIAQLIPQFYPRIGGAEVCIHNVSKTLSAFGHTPVVICTTPPTIHSHHPLYKIEHLWEKTCGLFRRLPYFVGEAYLKMKLRELQKKYNFDLWQITNGWPLGAFAVRHLNKERIPCILRTCGEDIQKFPQINYGVRLNPKIDKIISNKYPLFNGFVALTESVANEYEKLGIPRDKISIIPNGVNLSRFKKIDKCEFRRKIPITNPEKPLILTVGRYHPKKGFDSIPQIAEILRSRGFEFNWIIAGRGVCEIRKKNQQFNMENLFFLEDYACGNSDENYFELPPQGLVDLYCASDIFALPTLIETFGMVLVEAMAAALPIVTTTAEGVRDVISNETQGLCSSPGDNDAFANNIAKILSDKNLHQKLSESSENSAKQYDWQIVCKQYIDFYKKILNKNA